MNDVLIQQFVQLISNHTGLHIREQDRKALCNKLYARMKVLKLSTPENYYQILNTPTNHSNPIISTLGEREWQELTLLLTTGETFFFRDQGQFTLLRNRIIPELIERKQRENGVKPSLRIWSAGCSTGEEPYSLAILVKELIPNWNEWNILVVGTDINLESIEKAKRGIYDSWSFRMVNPDLQKRYFHAEHGSWVIDEQIRKLVKFRSGNLLKDDFPSHIADIQNMDIILCRNVFIYFDSETISVVVDKFYNTLNPGGYLITGHTELHGQNLGYLQSMSFTESVVYQRSENLLVKTPVLPASGDRSCVLHSERASRVEAVEHQTILPQNFTSSMPVTSRESKHNRSKKVYSASSSSKLTKENLSKPTSETALNEAEKLLENGAYRMAIKKAEQFVKEHPNHFDAYYLMAQAFANLGEYQQAIQCCQQALKVNDSSVKPYYLLARIAEEQGDVAQAKNILKKIIYLTPSSIPAYLELSSLYAREGDNDRAVKMRLTALEMLQQLPPDAYVEYQDGMTSGELLLHIKKLL